MKGHYPITAHVPTLDFVTRCHEINSKDPHSVIEPLKILHHARLSYTTKPSQNYRSMFPLTFDLSEIGS